MTPFQANDGRVGHKARAHSSRRHSDALVLSQREEKAHVTSEGIAHTMHKNVSTPRQPRRQAHWQWQITNTLPTPETNQAHSSHVHPPTVTLTKGCEDLEARVSQPIVIVAQQGWRWDVSLPRHDLRLQVALADCQHSKVTAKGQDKALRSVPRQTRSQTTIQPRD